jgi:nitroreductase
MLAGMGDSFFDVVHHQRACRSFTDLAVGDETIAKLLAAATMAPSSENMQPWVFIVVRDQELRQAIGDHMRRVWAAGGLERLKGRVPETLAADVDQGLMGGIAAAPTLIVVAGDTRRVKEIWLASSIFPAVQNLLLAAGALGLGSALTTLATVDRGVLVELLDLPEEVLPMALIPIGQPARPLSSPRRDSFTEHAYRDRYSETW